MDYTEEKEKIRREMEASLRTERQMWEKLAQDAHRQNRAKEEEIRKVGPFERWADTVGKHQAQEEAQKKFHQEQLKITKERFESQINELTKEEALVKKAEQEKAKQEKETLEANRKEETMKAQFVDKASIKAMEKVAEEKAKMEREKEFEAREKEYRERMNKREKNGHGF